jgi:hypothetical protein
MQESIQECIILLRTICYLLKKPIYGAEESGLLEKRSNNVENRWRFTPVNREREAITKI